MHLDYRNSAKIVQEISCIKPMITLFYKTNSLTVNVYYILLTKNNKLH